MQAFADCCFQVLQAPDATTLRSATARAADALGFEHITGFFAFDRPGRPTQFVQTACRIPAGYEEIFSDPSVGRKDPVSQYLKHHHTPIAWNKGFYSRLGQSDLWERVASFGYKTGISAALHMPHGRHHCFGLSRWESLPSKLEERNELVAKVHLLGCYVHEAASRMFSPLASGTEQLSRREQDCLRWTLEGKTAWEIGRILHFSERTVSALLARATKELDCVNKHQAALRAVQLGLIPL